MHQVRNPQIRFLSEPVILKIIDEALDVLAKVGVMVENKDALQILSDSGMAYDESTKIVKIKPEMVEQALKSAPGKIEVFDRNENLCLNLSEQNIHFNPGSAALHIVDYLENRPREATSADVVNFIKLEESLPHFAAQSTGLIASDVPEDISDRYRLYLALQFCQKPVVTGSFTLDGFQTMKEMLAVVRGSEEALKKKPLAIFDCCPSPPLKWSQLTCHDLMECAKSGIPAELVSMPLTGATAPATLLGALVQLTAENLSGLVIHQFTQPGAPIIFGGSPAAFDMRTGTTPMGAIETMMIDCCYAQIGRQLGLPTHAYMALSDAKQLDAQAGFETGIGAVLAALAGVNVISGPGMLDFESCQSLEKLVVDHEICGQAIRMKKGIYAHHEVFSADLYGDIYNGEFFFTSPNTLKFYKEEFYFPDSVIDRKNLQHWRSTGGETLWQRAHKRVQSILSSYDLPALSNHVLDELQQIMSTSAKKYGLEKLPRIQ